MELIKKENKTIIILKEGDVLELATMQGNSIHLEIKCKSGTLFVDEVTVKRIKEIGMEQAQVEILKRNNKE